MVKDCACPAAAVNYRLNLTSEMAPHINKSTTKIIKKKEGKLKIGRGSQMGA
jgi:hypothetical protein